MTFISFVKSFTPQSELRGKRKTKFSLTIRTSLIKPSLLTRIVEISRFGKIALIFCGCVGFIFIERGNKKVYSFYKNCFSLFKVGTIPIIFEAKGCKSNQRFDLQRITTTAISN